MCGKTLAFVGNSLGWQQFQSLICMVTGGNDRPDVTDVGKEYGLVKARGAVHPDGCTYRFPSVNTTIFYYWSASLCDLELLHRNDLATEIAMHLDRPPPGFLKRQIKDFDVLVLNMGHHWNRGKINGNSWVMYVGGSPNTDKRLVGIGNEKNFKIHKGREAGKPSAAEVPVAEGALPDPLSKAFRERCDWNMGGNCNNVVPTCLGKEVVQGESSVCDSPSVVKGTGVHLLDITALL